MKRKELTPEQLSAVPCPTCGVGVGERCVLHSGALRSEPHVDRKFVAAAAAEGERINPGDRFCYFLRLRTPQVSATCAEARGAAPESGMSNCIRTWRSSLSANVIRMVFARSIPLKAPLSNSAEDLSNLGGQSSTTGLPSSSR